MPQVRANGIAIEVETSGPEDGEPILLIRGLGTQLSQWPDELLDGLAGRGFRVVRFDNRDVGLSEGFEHAGVPSPADVLAARASGDEPAVPYRVADMADDAAGVLEALGIASAHVLGISLGGMIAQHVAARHPHRTRSLISVMSSSGEPSLPGPTPEAARVLTSEPERPDDRECLIEHGMETRRVLASPGFPETESLQRREVAAALDRAHRPDGVARQLAAVLADGSRVALLQALDVPTLVIHGTADPLVPPEAGESTARHVKGARLEWIEGMSHELPHAAMGFVVALVDDFARANAAR